MEIDSLKEKVKELIPEKEIEDFVLRRNESRERLSTAIKAALREQLKQAVADKKDWATYEVQRSLEAWIGNANPEGLVDFLDRNNGEAWKAVQGPLEKSNPIPRGAERERFIDQENFIESLTEVLKGSVQDPLKPWTQMPLLTINLSKSRLRKLRLLEKNKDPFSLFPDEAKAWRQTYERPTNGFTLWVKKQLTNHNWPRIEKLLPSTKDGQPDQWLLVLTREWIQSAGREEASKPRTVPLRLQDNSVSNAGRDYARVPKIAIPLTWAAGAGGKIIDEYEGYRVTPGMALYVPKHGGVIVQGILNAQQNAAHTMTLPLEMPEEQDDVAIALSGSRREVMSLPAIKIATALWIHTRNDPDKMRTTTLRELAKIVYPNARQVQKPYLKSILEALNQLKQLSMIWSFGRKDSIFDVQTFRGIPDWDAPLTLGMAQSFVQGTLQEINCGTLKTGDQLKKLNGDFVLPMKAFGLMKGGLWRQMVRVSAMANDYFDHKSRDPRPDLIKPFRPDAWAALNNYITIASDHKTDSTGRKARSAELRQMKEDTEQLEAEGLLIIKEYSKDRILLHPTPEHIEARNKLRKTSGC